MRKTLKLAAVAGAAVLAGGGAVVALGGSAATAAQADEPPPLVEDFSYPGAAEILAKHKILLKKGDGNILHVSCAAPGDKITLESYDHVDYVCFQLRGSRGYLTMEITRTVFLKSDNKPIQAVVILAGETKPEPPKTVEPNTWVPIGEAARQPAATLLEIRA